MRIPRLLAAAGLSALLVALTPAVAWAEPEAAVRHNARQPVAGAYLVTLKPGALAAVDTRATAESAVARYGGRLHSVYTRTMSGYAVEGLSELAARRIAARPEVASVTQSGTAGIAGTVTQPNPPNWGLDRIDQRALPLNREYRYDDTAAGQGVNVYIVDTGIRFTHGEFEGRAKLGVDYVSPGTGGTDCHGHGSHVAGIVGGKSYGVAKKATLWSVRILGCNGMGQDIDVTKAAEWITANAQKPAVVNMSIYTDDKDIAASAIKSSIASGVQWSLITGNNGGNACNYGPGGQVPEALQVGNVTSSDTKAGDSNYGTCMDLHAPGSSILSAYHTSDTATTTLSGTSMAAPHVAGAIARFLTTAPTATPAQIHTWVMDNATTGALVNLPSGTPNKLLYIPVADTPPPTGDFTVAASPASATVRAGESATTRITAAATGGAGSGSGPAVVGGQPTTVEENPFMISQRREGSSFPGQQSCSSTLMGPRTVLTAAHCLLENGGRKWFVYGATNLNDPGFTAEIASTWVHPSYTHWSEGYDVAVITLDRDVPVPAGMTYPTLNTSAANNTPGTMGTAIGWGKTGANTYSDVLRKADVPVAADSGCQGRFPGQYKTPAMICTGYADGHSAACVGDSGGPYLVGNTVVGVFSWMSTGCDWYAVYTRVSTYATEIAAHLPGTTPPPAGEITLAASGLPTGAAATFSPGSISVGGSSTLTVTTAASTPAGTYPITVTGTKGSTSARTTFTLTVTGGTPPTPGNLTLGNPGVQTGYVGRPVTLAMQASGGTTPYRFSATGLPSGLSINQSTGVISGTPSTWQNANVTVTVTDAAGRTAKAQFYWFIFPAQ
ncbi:subtilisin family serine protease [Allocatelliglobosispora scoriae]|uniref:Subtilisin family serine protease n=1 Tax=Allocatelliglobosispora scoriae TaxID=643052 RepID=A0A841BGG4_9ACTN|nr:trypsin-like serine protease [Allocatelliglobosispora scoriae]MBB5868177.1 subtilisin family serine protease [Allocatelliglobosispora scoriae]